GNRSSLLTFPVSVTSGATTNVSGIFVAPTIAIDKSEVKRGDSIAIFGQSVPQSDIVISVNSDEEFFARTISDKNGIYLHNFDTSLLDYGTHTTKSKALIGNQLVSSWSYLVGFKVGTKNVLAQLPTKFLAKGDLNGDKRINLVDFSIAAYWYKRTISAEFAVKEKERLNGDGKVDLIDFSIMAFYWTG
ncbi:dockerin type I repeat-containing protein, partial [Patescibacteria group bacterium]|nr:dockerin type I repeat-containing protein [Patescibacteria group bacterium]